MLLLAGLYLILGIAVGGIKIIDYKIDLGFSYGENQKPLLANDVLKLIWLAWKWLTVAVIVFTVCLVWQQNFDAIVAWLGTRKN